MNHCYWEYNEVESDETASPDVYDTSCGQKYSIDDDCTTREPQIPEKCYHCNNPVLHVIGNVLL